MPSSSLIPDDPSVLFTTAGMQQFKKYFTGELDPIKDFGSKNVTSVQKCFRTSDIDEVGDESHLTFFEMMGNFSFGGYFKKEAIIYAHEFIAKELGLSIDYVSVFEGDADVPADMESEEIWKSLGVKDVRKFGRKDNFWGPTGAEGPCGPTSEVYVRGVEVWNLVFNEYYQDKNKKLTPLKVKGIDTGMGLERLAMMVQNTQTIFETDLFKNPLSTFMHLPGVDDKSGRIFADHIRGATFLIADGVLPSNKDAGYILRRLIRRAIFHSRKLTGEDNGGGFKLSTSRTLEAVKNTISFYGNSFENYKNLLVNEKDILKIFKEEQNKFIQTLDNGIREFNRLHNSKSKVQGESGGSYKIFGKISAEDAFHLYQSYGLPREIIRDLCVEREAEFDDKGFDKEFEKHQEISRAGVEKKFGGHGLTLDTGELKAGSEEEQRKVIKFHTATHLLHQALLEVLGNEVEQRGSDITPERTRFDFTFPRKVTPEELKRIEEIVNEKIKADLPVKVIEMSKAEAEKTGALKFFKGKYSDKVTVYFIGDSLENAFNKEFCAGPHVSRTSEIGKFKITKEESSSAGIRRIRAIIE